MSGNDFFTEQDRVFNLTEKVLRLCGEYLYLKLPSMANVEDLAGRGLFICLRQRR
jgi:hypothetical protein